MSTDPIGVAFGRDDATDVVRMLQIAAEPSNELTGIATAIERVEALLAAYAPGPDGADAIERIADIAFVLHERDVEASLCDALDAAVRELANADAAKQVNVQHVRQAAELLRELSHRVGDMIALPQVLPPPAANGSLTSELAPSEPEATLAEELPSSEDTLNGDIPREGLFAAELLEDDEFARAVAELAASLPALAEPVEAFGVTPRKPGDLAADEPALTPEPSEEIAEAAHEPVDLVGDESVLAPEPEEALAETPQQPADLAADESALAAALEALAEAQQDERALAAEQQTPVTDYASAIEITPAEELPIADEVSEQLARDDSADEAIPSAAAPPEAPENEAISHASPLSEGALSETFSCEALSEDAGAMAEPAPDLPGDSADHVLASEHATVSLPDADAADGPVESLPTPAPEETPGHETANRPDDAPATASSAELEPPPPGDAPPPPADAAADVAAEQPSDQIIARANGGDGPAQTADEAKPHGINNMLTETPAAVNEATPPRKSESSQSLLPELALVDPQDDPGDLFEPLASEASLMTAANLAGPQSASEISAPAATTQAPHAAAATDPLAAMRALSAEELLALFT